MKIARALWASFVMACSGGSAQNARQTAEAEPADVRSPEVAGGETSEFSGDIGACPEIVSSEPLDLEDARIAPWVERVEGHHEQTLGWRRTFLSDGVRGFEEHTTLLLDVNVRRGRDVLYGTGGSTLEELDVCDGLRARQIELDVELRTADGAIALAFQRWYEPRTDEGGNGERLEEGWLTPDQDRDGIAFTGSLELGVDPALGSTPRMWVALSFDAESARGYLFPEVTSRDPSRVSSWTPIEANFPDDACQGSGAPIGLDETVASLAETPRARYRRAAAAWENEPIPAVWQAAPYGIERPGAEIPPPTEVSLSPREPTHACISSGYVTVHAPLTIVTADGRVNLTQSLAVALLDADGAIARIRTPWVPAADFAAEMGLMGAQLDSGAYGAVDIYNTLSVEEDYIDGAVRVSQWAEFGEGLAEFPTLEWCKGTGCVAQPDR